MTIGIDHFHKQLVKDAIPRRLSSDDAMLLFHLLHMYEIEALPDVFQQNSDGSTVAPITQRHAAEVIASLYRDRKKKKDDHRATYEFWYWKWNGDWGSYAREDRFSEAEKRRLEELKAQIEDHPWVLEMREAQ